MRKMSKNRSRRIGVVNRVALLAALLAAVAGGSLFFSPAPEAVEAAAPSSGSVTAVEGTAVTWTGNRAGAAANGEPSCADGSENAANCDNFTLTVNGTAEQWAGKRVRIRFTWIQPGNDFDMTVRKESNGTAGLQGDSVLNTPPAANPNFDATVGTSGNGTNTFEELVISPADSGADGTVYYVRSIYFAVPVAADQYQGSATVFSVSNTLPTGNFVEPTYDNYQPPVGYPQRDNSGEPSVGVNFNTGNVMSMSRLRGNRTTFTDSTSPADPIDGTFWFSNTSPLIRTGLDPILFTDSLTGRTLGGELSGNFTNGFVSDDDLSTITADFIAGSAVASVDHQTVGGGPPKKNPADPVLVARQPKTNYPHLFYYAAQNIGYADVATSFDGGLTFDKAVPAYTVAQCGGLHGHIKVAPDGTVYLPNKNCGGKAAVVVSEDNGLRWSVRPIPSSTAGDNDPSVGIGAGGRIFVSYTSSDKHPRVAVSDDKGLTWRDDYDLALGVSPNLKAAVFPAVVGGDNNRAAAFFLATDSTNDGDPTGDDAGTPFKGTWYPYIATTIDGGKSWKVVRADNDPLHPDVLNPVQQGVVCTNGTTCPAGTRNLLDFNDITVDSRGRVVAVYADGCNFDHPCINITDDSGDKTTNQKIARLTIIRQRGGVRLFAAFDAGGPAAPALSPPTQIQSSKNANTLFWATPDDNGSPLTAYRIYRGQPGRGEQLVAEVKAKTHSFVDRERKSGSLSGAYYHVTAVNQYGESPRAAKNFAAKSE